MPSCISLVSGFITFSLFVLNSAFSTHALISCLKSVIKWFFSFIVSKNIVWEFVKMSRLCKGKAVGTKIY